MSRFYHPGQKPPELLSRQPNPGSKTGTNGPLEPGQMAQSVVVALNGKYHTILSKQSTIGLFARPEVSIFSPFAAEQAWSSAPS